ncbi:MAG: hypothetical protein WD696_03030 [Bryobacteraceae bacterium]
MKSVTLRDSLREPILALKDSVTHEDLPSVAERLGLPPLPDEGSKRDRLRAGYEAVPESELPAVAERLWTSFPLEPSVRNTVQDLAWAAGQYPAVPKRFRRELARKFDSASDLFLHAGHFDSLLERLWIIDDPLATLFGGRASGLRAEIQQHVVRNPEDWTAEYLFERLGAFEASDRRFLLFIEGLASADVRPDVDSQRRFVQTVNATIQACGIEFQETGSDGGYPVYRLTWKSRSPGGRPKNLIFASSVKPDLRFRDAVNNDIEIVSNPQSVLVYDSPISADGLTWQDLQNWWSAREKVDQTAAKKGLYQCLLSCLPSNSPPQRLLFKSYFEHFRHAIPGLPALLPEVWLHWDPKTVQERGPDALLRFRMDFLLLLPNNVRVVIEVDGKQHYADDDGAANPHKYAAMVAADRDLQLAGYEVYHFGGAELSGDAPHSIAVQFFDTLFKAHHITIAR